MKLLLVTLVILAVAFAAPAPKPTVEQDAKEMLAVLNEDNNGPNPAALAQAIKKLAEVAAIQKKALVSTTAAGKPRRASKAARTSRKKTAGKRRRALKAARTARKKTAGKRRRALKAKVSSPFAIGNEKKTRMPRATVKLSRSQGRLMKRMWSTVHKLWGTDARVVRKSAIRACVRLWKDTAIDSILTRKKLIIGQFYSAIRAVFRDENKGANRAYEQWVNAHPSDKNRLMRVTTRVGRSIKKMALAHKRARKALKKTVAAVIKANKKIALAARKAETLALDAVATAQRHNTLARQAVVAAADAAKKETAKVVSAALQTATKAAMRRISALHKELAKARAARLTAERKVAALEAALRRCKGVRKLAKKSKTIRKLLKRAIKNARKAKKAKKAKKVVKKVAKKKVVPKKKSSGFVNPEYILLKNDKPRVQGTSITLPLIPNDELVKQNLLIVKNKITGLPEFNEKKLAKAATLVGKAKNDREVTAGKLSRTCLTGTCENA